MKKLLKIVGIVVLLALVALLALPLWVGPVVKGVANAVVPGKTKTEFSLAHFALNPYAGRLEVGGMTLGNPDGFSPKNAVTLGSLAVAVDATTLLSDVIVVESIELRDVFVSYVKHDGKYNFEVIGENASGPEEPKEEKPEEEPKDDSGKGKRVIVDAVSITGVTFQWGPVPMPLPPIVLKGIGRAQGGIDADVAWEEIWKKILETLGGVGVSIKDLGLDTEKLANELTAAGVKNADKVVDAIKNVRISGSGEGAETAKKAVEAVGDAFKDAGGDTSKALKDAGEKLKGLFK